MTAVYKEELIIALLSGFGIASIPVFFIFLDYHKRSNVHRAVLYVAIFFAITVVVANMQGRTLLNLACATPVLLFGYVLLMRWRSQKKTDR